MKILIRDYRLSEGITLSELASETGLSISYLSEVETEKKPITINNLCIVAKALNVKVEKLYKC